MALNKLFASTLGCLLLLTASVAFADPEFQVQTEQSAAATPTRKSPLSYLPSQYKKPLLILAGVLGTGVVGWYTYDNSIHESTDDAYVTSHLHAIASRNSGIVSQVLVNDNQFVHEGDVLVQLDQDQNEAIAKSAKAKLDEAQENLNRLEPLVASHAVASQDVDQAKATRDVDLAEYQLAKIQLDNSTIKAPATGYVGRRNVEVGNSIAAGQALMTVVEPQTWILANFKETQLSQMRKGEDVEITIDSVPNKVFRGTVDSFSPATGNQFALLPADNSTGNFTKVVQRLPVKIIFDADTVRGYEQFIRAGESATVRVLTQRNRKVGSGLRCAEVF